MKINAETQAIAQSLAEQIGRMSDSEAEGPEAAAIRRRLIDLVGQAQADELTLAASNAAGLATLAARAARALRAIPSEARSEQSRANGRRGGRRPLVYALSSVKGPHGYVSGYREAVSRARELQADLQAAYGITVSRPDGSTAYTAR